MCRLLEETLSQMSRWRWCRGINAWKCHHSLVPGRCEKTGWSGLGGRIQFSGVAKEVPMTEWMIDEDAKVVVELLCQKIMMAEMSEDTNITAKLLDLWSMFLSPNYKVQLTFDMPSCLWKLTYAIWNQLLMQTHLGNRWLVLSGE